MKTNASITIAFYACVAFGKEVPLKNSDSSLPLLAAVCDIAGIGELVSQTRTNAVISVNQCWFSTTPATVVEIQLYGNEYIPAGGTNFLFFASQYPMDYGPNIPGPYPSMFRMDEVRGSLEPEASMSLMSAGRSLIPVTAENAALISWSSNLVHASQASPNMQAFYELIRDCYRFNAEHTRIHCDSIDTFTFASYYMPASFMQQIWTDTNLVYLARAEIREAHKNATGSFLEWDIVRDGDSVMPLLAAACDVIGIGEIESKTSTNAVINVSQLWFGDPQQTRLDARLDGEGFPEPGMPFLFFLSSHPQISAIEPWKQRFELLFNPAARDQFQTGGFYFLGGSRAAVPATPVNSALISWHSNLVHATQVNPDMHVFMN